jgi:hypothetical protein
MKRRLEEQYDEMSKLPERIKRKCEILWNVWPTSGGSATATTSSATLGWHRLATTYTGRQTPAAYPHRCCRFGGDSCGGCCLAGYT